VIRLNLELELDERKFVVCFDPDEEECFTALEEGFFALHYGVMETNAIDRSMRSIRWETYDGQA
jgi:hypothetical protein